MFGMILLCFGVIVPNIVHLVGNNSRVLMTSFYDQTTGERWPAAIGLSRVSVGDNKGHCLLGNWNYSAKGLSMFYLRLPQFITHEFILESNV